MRCYIFQCRDLPSADDDGSSDPFLQIFNTDGDDVRSSVIDDNLNPIYYESRTFDYEFNGGIKNAPPIIISAFDTDAGFISSSNDYLARAVIYLDNASVNEDETQIPDPKWHDFKFGIKSTDPSCGQILCSFTVLDAGKEFTIPDEEVDIKSKVLSKEYSVMLNVLGLRDLKSAGLLPVQKAFVQFDLKSLLPAGTAGMENKRTLPNKTGSNPNITTVIEFKLPLPVEQLYCPKLSCTVYDQVFVGFSQPRVGNFTIPIGDIMHAGNLKRSIFTKKAEHIISSLQSILDGKAADQIQAIDLDAIKIEIEKEGNERLLKLKTEVTALKSVADAP